VGNRTTKTEPCPLPPRTPKRKTTELRKNEKKQRKRRRKKKNKKMPPTDGTHAMGCRRERPSSRTTFRQSRFRKRSRFLRPSKTTARPGKEERRRQPALIAGGYGVSSSVPTACPRRGGANPLRKKKKPKRHASSSADQTRSSLSFRRSTRDLRSGERFSFLSLPLSLSSSFYLSISSGSDGGHPSLSARVDILSFFPSFFPLFFFFRIVSYDSFPREGRGSGRAEGDRLRSPSGSSYFPSRGEGSVGKGALSREEETKATAGLSRPSSSSEGLGSRRTGRRARTRKLPLDSVPRRREGREEASTRISLFR